MRTRSNAQRCFAFICMLLSVLPLFAEEAKPQEQAGAAATKPVAPDDIWQEVTFDSGQQFELSETRIESILEGIQRTDPQKAESLQKLRDEDPKKFLEAIRLEIGGALQPKAAPDQKTAPAAAGRSEWQEQLQKRYASFMEWLAKEFPSDHAELLKVRDADAEKYVQKVMDTMTIYEPIMKAQKYNAALASVMKEDIELQKKRDALLLQIRTAGGDEHPGLVKQLEALVAARFDIIVRKKELQNESLRKRLEKLSEQLDQQALELENLKKNKAQTVEEHLKELMSRSEKITL